jgi:hypothetical protein
MPWQEVTLMSQRKEFVPLAHQGEAHISRLRRYVQVSRKTAYKWLGRYRQKGAAVWQFQEFLNQVKDGASLFSHGGPGAGAADVIANCNHEDTVEEEAYLMMPGGLEAARMLAASCSERPAAWRNLLNNLWFFGGCRKAWQ